MNSILLLATKVQSQVYGIGPFKVGTYTTAQLQVLAEANGIRIVQTSDKYSALRLIQRDTTSNIIELMEAEEIEPYGERPRSEYEKVYFINYFLVSRVPLRNIKLRFWKDTLYSFHCEGSSRILKALIATYGKGETDIKEKRITCRTSAGVTYLEIEQTNTTSWNNKAFEISASFVSSLSFNSECKKTYLQFVLILNEKISDLLDERSKVEARQIEQEKSRTEKEEQKDF